MKTYTFHDPGGRAAQARMPTLVFLVVVAIDAIAQSFMFIGLQRFPSSEPLDGNGAIIQLGAVGSIAGAIALLQFLAFVVSGTLILMWIYRVVANALAADAQIATTPGAAVASFFVPFLNLIKPFKALSEAWRGSVAPATPGLVEVPPLLRWWWGLWIVSSILGNVSFQIERADPTVGGQAAASAVQVVTNAVSVALSFILLRVIAELTSIQQSHQRASVFE